MPLCCSPPWMLPNQATPVLVPAAMMGAESCRHHSCRSCQVWPMGNSLVVFG